MPERILALQRPSLARQAEFHPLLLHHALMSPFALPALTSGISMAQHQDPDQQHRSRLVKVGVGLLKQLDINKCLRGF